MDTKGFSGLEAAIVLISFIIVAAVFSYIILNLGFFTASKSKQLVHGATTGASSALILQDPVIGICKNVVDNYTTGYYVDLDGNGIDPFLKCSSGTEGCSCFYNSLGQISNECAKVESGYKLWQTGTGNYMTCYPNKTGLVVEENFSDPFEGSEWAYASLKKDLYWARGMSAIFSLGIGDLDGDNFEDDIFVGARDILAFNSTGKLIYYSDIPGEILGNVIEDFDEDGYYDDVAFLESGYVKVIDNFATPIWTSPYLGTLYTIEKVDLDNDAMEDDLIIGADGEVIAFLGNKTEFLEQWRYSFSGIPYELALGDFTNNDLTSDIAVASSSGYVHVISANGLLIWNSSYLGEVNSISAADLDSDGFIDDIAVGAYGKLIVYEGTGTAFVELWNVTLSSDNIYEITIADLDNDSVEDDIVFGCYNFIYGYDNSSNQLFAHQLPRNLPITSIAVGDVNNDTLPEIVFNGNGWYLYVWILNQTGHLIFTKRTNERIDNEYGNSPQVKIADIDKDGANDIILGGYIGKAMVVSLGKEGDYLYLTHRDTSGIDSTLIYGVWEWDAYIEETDMYIETVIWSDNYNNYYLRIGNTSSQKGLFIRIGGVRQNIFTIEDIEIRKWYRFRLTRFFNGTWVLEKNSTFFGSGTDNQLRGGIRAFRFIAYGNPLDRSGYIDNVKIYLLKPSNYSWFWDNVDHCIDPDPTDYYPEFYYDSDGVPYYGYVSKVIQYEECVEGTTDNCACLWDAIEGIKCAKMNTTSWKYWKIVSSGEYIDCEATKDDANWDGKCIDYNNFSMERKISKLKLYLKSGEKINFKPNVTVISFVYPSEGRIWDNLFTSIAQIEFIGESNGDFILDPGETLVITIGGIYERATIINNGSFIGILPDKEFFIEIKPPGVPSLTITKRTPPTLRGITLLH